LISISQNTYYDCKIHARDKPIPRAGERLLVAPYRRSKQDVNLQPIPRARERPLVAPYRRSKQNVNLCYATAFACTDYKVQGKTLDKVALELRGTRTINLNGEVVPSMCDPYGLYVQLSRSRSLGGIMLLSKVRERDIVGNTVPENMVAAEKMLERLSQRTIADAEQWDWLDGKL
jgi:hypothetical protein